MVRGPDRINLSATLPIQARQGPQPGKSDEKTDKTAKIELSLLDLNPEQRLPQTSTRTEVHVSDLRGVISNEVSRVKERLLQASLTAGKLDEYATIISELKNKALPLLKTNILRRWWISRKLGMTLKAIHLSKEALHNKAIEALKALPANASPVEVEQLCSCLDPSKLNTPDTDGNTPLHLAAQRGNVAAVQQLIKLGADIKVRNNKGETSLLVLLKNVSNPEGIAAACALFDKDTVNQADADGKTPLHIAAYRAEPADIQILLDKGASRTSVNTLGETPIQLANLNQKQANSQVLLKAVPKEIQEPPTPAIESKDQKKTDEPVLSQEIVYSHKTGQLKTEKDQKKLIIYQQALLRDIEFHRTYVDRLKAEYDSASKSKDEEKQKTITQAACLLQQALMPPSVRNPTIAMEQHNQGNRLIEAAPSNRSVIQEKLSEEDVTFFEVLCDPLVSSPPLSEPAQGAAPPVLFSAIDALGECQTQMPQKSTEKIVTIITHLLSAYPWMATQTYRGKTVEQYLSEKRLFDPAHSEVQKLLQSAPRLSLEAKFKREVFTSTRNIETQVQLHALIAQEIEKVTLSTDWSKDPFMLQLVRTGTKEQLELLLKRVQSQPVTKGSPWTHDRYKQFVTEHLQASH